MKIYLIAVVGFIANIMHKLSTGNLSASESEAKEEMKPLRLDLQFFAEKGDDDEEDDEEGDEGKGDDDEEEDEEEGPDFDELMKNPTFRKKHKERLETQLGKRLKKFEGVDVEEYKRLKAAADKGKDKKEDNDTNKADDEVAKKLMKVETREKKAAVKTFAVENEVDPELLIRFIDLKEIELDEDGDPENLEDLFDDLMESKNAKYFTTASDDDDEEDDPKKKKASKTYSPGTKQKINKQKKVDPKQAGAAKAAARHKKKEE